MFVKSIAHLTLLIVLYPTPSRLLRFMGEVQQIPKHQPARISGTFLSTLWPQQSPSRPTDLAESVVKKALVAYGGESKLVSFTNASFQYQVEPVGDNASKPVQVKAYFKDANLFRSEVAGGGSDAVTILNGDKGWVKVGDTTLSLTKKNLDPVKTAMISQLRPDLLLVSLQKFRYAGKADDEGHKLDLVEVSGFLGGEYVRGRLSFDSSTHLIYKYEFEIERELPKGKGIVQGEEKYISYLEIEGLKVPAEIASRQGRKTSRIRINQVDLKSTLDASLFQDPGPISAAPTGSQKPE
jgi:hypothetical protein